MSDELTVQRAVEAARAQPHHFIFVPDGASPAVVEALRALAASTGREFMPSQVKSPTADFVQGYLNRERPVVKRGDNGAFLDALKAIASGKVAVK